MYLGVDYYPEHWSIDLIDEDIDRIKKMNANIVRIGEFAWHMMEKKEGEFDFSFFDMVIGKLKEKEIKVMFGTPTATFPAWLYKKHPQILSKWEDENERVFGGRRQYCYNSSEYLSYSLKIVKELVTHYKDEENIIAWQVDNEFGHEGSDMCHCEKCHHRFQDFLRNKFNDNIDNLNETYGTIFWGQTYNSFSEIPIPKKTITVHNPSLVLDWYRFRSYSLNSFAHANIEEVKKYKGEHQKVTTNLAGGFFDKCFNHQETAKPLDFVSYDNYPVWGGLKEPVHNAQTALSLDFIRGLKGENFWIVEQLMGAQGHDVIGYLPRPLQAKMWSYQAFAHGCSNMLYFRYRGMNKGAEQYCYGIIDHNNKLGRKYEEASSFFNEIKEFGDLVDSPIDSQVAVLYDHDNIWSWKIQTQSSDFDFTKEILRLYRPFYKKNINIDVIPVSSDISKYKVLILPVMKLVDKALSEKLEKFVSQGNTIIFSFRSGIKDKDNNIIFGKTLPSYIAELCGIEIHESEALNDGQSCEVLSEAGKIGICHVFRDICEVTTAKALYSYDDHFYKGKACITVNEYGQGKAYYIGAGVDEDIVSEIASEILIDKNISYIESPEGLEVYPRSLNGQKYYIITNHTSNTIEFLSMNIEAYESKIVKDEYFEANK